MKKIALVSCYFKENYGSMLQAFALQEFLRSKGYPVENINVKNLDDFSAGKKKYYKKKIFDLKFVAGKFGMIKMKIKRKVSHSELVKNLSIRDRKFSEFKHNFYLSKTFRTYQELTKETPERYSDVIVGSDQLWLPVNVVADYYTLNWAPDNINKISFSTSLGISSIPKKYDFLYQHFLSRINHISLREENATNLIREKYHLDAVTVCDPTMLLTKEEWLSHSSSERKVKESYIFVYLLGKNKEHWEFVRRLKKKTGLKVVSLNHCDEYFRLADKYSDEPLYDVDPFDFINLIHYAEYICTDSFHGSVFSILNQKKFFTFRRFSDKSVVSTNSRIYSLLKNFGLENRLLTGNEDVEKAIEEKLDFSAASVKLEELRKTSSQWLLDSISYQPDRPNRVDELAKRECCGCHACLNICPKQCIQMKEDEEGFLYPSIDTSACIHCGLCMKACPVNKKQEYSPFKQYGYVVQNKDEAILKESTSGGAFTAFADTILDKGGVVYGVALDKERFEAHHIRVTKKKDLSLFRNSKYVQASTGTTYRQVKQDLMNNIPVLYSGTICQIEGLLSYLALSHVNTDKLSTVDVICRCVTSPKVLKEYISYEENRNKKTWVSISFRDKSFYGYNWSNLSLEDKDGKKSYHNGLNTDLYLKLMFDGYSVRPSCYDCHFKHQQRNSDMTIWDCFDVRNYALELDNGKGATKVLINSEKGKKLFEESAKELYCHPFSDYQLIYNNYEMFNSPKEAKQREAFFECFERDSKKAFEDYASISAKDRVSNLAKKIFVKCGLYSKMKAKQLRGRKNG
jgi:formate hydrogenlyase subunit 6/NADH:ubiquinone oxidoreductase subunit I